ncbi:MAG: 50S ribosomal protein L25 [Actinobacteria bacterium]|nr:50S ribosomal protein L25 [Actinomycetota bacterium]
MKIKVSKRKELGTGPSKRLRAEGEIPGVVYGSDMETIPIKIDATHLKEIFKAQESGEKVMELSIKGDRKKKNYNVMIKDVHKHYITRDVLNIDFHSISLKEKVHASIPIIFTGEPIGVKEDEGTLGYHLRHIDVECLPKDLPEHFEVNIEDLKIGDVLRVSDIKYSGEIKILVNPNDVILSVSAPRMEVEEEVVEEEEEFIETEEKEPEVIGEKEKEKEKVRKKEK